LITKVNSNFGLTQNADTGAKADKREWSPMLNKLRRIQCALCAMCMKLK